MKQVLFILLLAVSAQAYAGSKVPGYQGYRFSMIYDPAIMHPAIIGKPGKLPMLFHQGTVDYVVSRGVSIGLQYGFMFYKSKQNGNYASDANKNDFKERYIQHTLGFNIKMFYKRAGYIAPVGRYVTWGLYYQHAVDHRMGYIDAGLTGYKGTANFGGITWGMGRNFIVGKRFIIDFGFTLNYSPYLPISRAYDNKKLDIRQNALWRNFFKIYLGFGGLVF